MRPDAFALCRYPNLEQEALHNALVDAKVLRFVCAKLQKHHAASFAATNAVDRKYNYGLKPCAEAIQDEAGHWNVQSWLSDVKASVDATAAAVERQMKVASAALAADEQQEGPTRKQARTS